MVILASCGIKTRTLLNGVTKVPIDKYLIFDSRTYNYDCQNIIDTSSYYIGKPDNSGWIGTYKFYANGRYNWFYSLINSEGDSIRYNPLFNGYRGLYYCDGTKLICELYAPGNQMKKIKKLKRVITTYKDTLYVKREFEKYDTFYKLYDKTNKLPKFRSW